VHAHPAFEEKAARRCWRETLALPDTTKNQPWRPRPGAHMNSPMAIVRKRTWKSAKGAGTAFSVDHFDAQGKRQRKQFNTRAEANDFRVEIEGQMRSGTYRPEATKILVSELADLFLSIARRGWSAASA
jgi:hypothetical protein